MIYIFIFAWICRPASIFFHTFLVSLIFVDLLVAFELRQMHMYYIESICSNDSFLFFFFLQKARFTQYELKDKKQKSNQSMKYRFMIHGFFVL